jgi:hypothetical protein
MADTENKVLTPAIETKKPNNNVNIAQEVKKNKETFQTYLANQNKKKVIGSEALVPFLGTVFTIHVNGITVSLPLDGKPHEFPAGIANLLEKKLAKIAKANLRVNKTTKLY